jgi:hypothetical protein
MLPGFSGSLVSEYYAEVFLPEAFCGELGEDTRESARKRLVRWARGPARELGPVSSARSVYDLAAVPLMRALGYEPAVLLAASDRRFVLSRLGLSMHDCVDGSVPSRRGAEGAASALLVTPWAEPLDAAWRTAMRQVIATSVRWCLMTNGCQLRLVDVSRAFASCFIEFDLGCAIDNAASFAVLWGLFRRSGFGPSPLIDRVSEASARHAIGVCRSLRLGVLEAIGELLSGLVGSAPPGRAAAPGIDEVHEQSLTVVYRILFLLFAESRGLVPLWHPVYRDSYSIEALRDLVERPGRPRGLWEALQAISRLAHAGCRSGTLRVTPFNGRLFAPSVTPLADSRRVDDEAARRVLLALSTTPPRGRGGRARIAYRDLGVEELGAVYESVLDYRPQFVPSGGDSHRPPRPLGVRSARGRVQHVDVRLVPGSGVRKATGTFYTPRSITTYLVRRTLAPLVAGASPEDVLSLRVVDPAMGSGAFLVAACRYLSGAYESALIARGGCHASDVSDGDRRGFRRMVAQRCLFGVDRNPMAVQLARLSMWLCTLAPERPLTFLDHHLLVGNSLVGASLDDLRRPPPGALARGNRGDTAARLPMFGVEEAGPVIRAVLPTRNVVASTPDESLAVVREKERLLAGIAGPSSPLSAWKAAADLWCSFAFRPGSHASNTGLFDSLADALLSGHSSLPENTVSQWLQETRAIAARRRFFHWALELPEVFYGPDGAPSQRAGFDAVVGNPPWDMIRGDNGEGADRESARADSAGLFRFARSSGVYRTQGEGHGNLFQLFVERACHLARAGGRIGLVVPWGLAADHGCAPLRRLLFDQCRVDSWVGFENTSAIFPIHRSVRFVLLTASTGGRTDAITCRLGLRDPGVLDSDVESDADSSPARGVIVTRRLLERLSPGDLAVPDVKTAMDLALLEKITASVAPLSSPDGWGARFGRELNATDDRRYFHDGADGLPVLEGKHVEPFHVRTPTDGHRLPTAAAARLLDQTQTWGRPRLAYRDVAGPTNRLTLIAAVVPAGCVTVHTLFCLKTPLPESSRNFLCGVLNSFVANYLVRLRVTTHVTTAIVERLPVPRPAAHSPLFQRISDLASRLECSLSPQRDAAYVELQAAAARLYGLTLDELKHVLGTFPLIDDQTKEGTLTKYVSCDLAI